MKPVRKRGAPKAKQFKVSPRAIIAAALALHDASLLRARLLDPEVTLTSVERTHIARDWHPKRKGKRGRPRPPAWITPVEALAVARFYIWAAYRGRGPGDQRGVQEAERATVQKFGRRTWDRHKQVALDWQRGKWWPAACQLARGNKREELLHY
jgi:hypothetical protein